MTKDLFFKMFLTRMIPSQYIYVIDIACHFQLPYTRIFDFDDFDLICQFFF